jgi:hypothetical protein
MLNDNGVDVTSHAVANAYTISMVTADHTVTATFATSSIIFWRNTSTGENSVWYMDGSTHTATAMLDPLTGPWRMVATADFNNDGIIDLFDPVYGAQIYSILDSANESTLLRRLKDLNVLYFLKPEPANPLYSDFEKIMNSSFLGQIFYDNHISA